MNFQDASNLQIPEGYVRTIHDKDGRLLWGSVGYDVSFDGNATQTGTPTPDNPQPISVVTGENVVKIEGKNLEPPTWAQSFVTAVNDSSKAQIVTEDGKECLMFKPNAGYNSYDIKNFTLGVYFEPNTQYTVTFDQKSTAQNRHVAIYYTDGTYSVPNYSAINTWETVTIKSTAGKSIAYIAPFYTSGDTYIDVNTIQIELGNQATSYQAFTEQDYTISLGSLELAKIGTYQDRIYKDGEKWYVEKNVGKVVLDGSETWAYYSSYGGFRYRNDDFNVSSNNPSEDLICSHFTVATVRGTSPTAPVIKSYTLNTDSTYIFLCDGTSDVDAFKQWLSAHPTTVYYALATPTTTEITNQSLIDQLEAVYDWVRRHGYNAQVSGDLPIVINRTALPTA